MSERNYRLKLYANYVTVQVPAWTQPNEKQNEINAKASLKRLHEWLPKDLNAKVLDLGCGSGLFLQTLKRAGYKNVMGVDVGGQAISIARKLGLDVTMGDLREFLRTSEDTFDLITAFDVIEHFDKDEIIELLALIHHRLKPGSRIILQTPNALSPWAANYRYHDFTHEWIFDPHCMSSTLHLVGFESVQIKEITPYVHGPISAIRWMLWNAIRGLCAIWNLAETGSDQGGIYTRNMIASAIRP